MINIILESRYFCDSDKYSFVASLTSVPETQRNMMLTQFDEQNTAIQELKNSELNTNSVDRSAIANSYIQNIYRFFKLYPRSSEFNNPFNNPFDVTDIQVINENVDLDDALPIIAEFYLKNEYYNEAIKYFEILNNSEHSRKTVYLQKIGFCYQNTERYNEAIEYYHKYELNSNNDLWNLRHLAACYRALRQPAMALKYYKSAEEISPENISICLNIGHCLLETEQYEEALKYYYKVYYLDPNNPRAWRPIAWCLFIQGNYSQSRIYYDKIIQNNPNSNDYLNHGHVAFIEGNIPIAIESYKKAIEVNGNSLQQFILDFHADENSLLKAGACKTDISIILDAVMLDLKNK